MMPPVEALLPQEMVIFQPRSGVFDVEKVAEAIGRIGFSFRDDADAGRYAICSSAEARDMFQARRRADPDGPFPFILLVDIAPGTVTVSPITYDDEQRALSHRVLEWLTTNYDCHIGNELGADLRSE